MKTKMCYQTGGSIGGRRDGHGPECGCADCTRITNEIRADIAKMRAIDRIGSYVRDGCEGRPGLLDD